MCYLSIGDLFILGIIWKKYLQFVSTQCVILLHFHPKKNTWRNSWNYGNKTTCGAAQLFFIIREVTETPEKIKKFSVQNASNIMYNLWTNIYAISSIISLYLVSYDYIFTLFTMKLIITS